MPYNTALEKLHAGILQGDAGLAAPVVREKPHMTARAQIAIYNDAYRIRLTQAVLSDYPCLAAHMGDTAMQQLIASYIEATPSNSYSLDFYPHGFWRFVGNGTIPPALNELAALEGAIAEVFMGPGTEALTPGHLPPLDPENLGRMRFHLRTPSRLQHFAHDVESTMAAFKRGEAPAPIAANDIFIFLHRHNNEVQRRVLEPGEYHLLNAINHTDTFNDAIQQAVDALAGDETTVANGISRWLPRWIGEGFFAYSPA